MSFRRNTIGTRSSSVTRHQSSRYNVTDVDTSSSKRIDSLPNVLPELTKIIRKILPHEIPFNVHVRNVEYKEHGCERLNGTLYLTSFRLVFAPDNEFTTNNIVLSENKYLGDHDIPLTSIYKVDVAPVNTRSGFKSFLNENQIQSETRAFTIITRDFRRIYFSKCLVIKSNQHYNKPQTSVSKMGTYINALKAHCRFQDKEQLYPFLAIHKPIMHHRPSRLSYDHSVSSMGSPVDDLTDFCISNDERIRGFLFSYDWDQELKDADETRWVVDHTKFDNRSIIRENCEGPYICLAHCHEDEDFTDTIWHWSHVSEAEIVRGHQHFRRSTKYMLVTLPGIGETSTIVDPDDSPKLIPRVQSSSIFSHLSKKLPKALRAKYHDDPLVKSFDTYKMIVGRSTTLQHKGSNHDLRRNATDTSLMHTFSTINEQTYRRFNLSKFPCSLKRIQASYEKLIELCAIAPDDGDTDDDDDKWLSKLQACKWLKLVSKTLHGAASLARLLNYTNIQFVGSDVDHSCLMSSLIQIFLRPKCRTIKGFCELIVREWMGNGHPFRERFGQVATDANGISAQEAPVFLLFLDCVHQLINQNPCSFEFTEYLLIQLYYSACYCYHHTFIFNSLKERLAAIRTCPNDILILSSFDFSLYLNPNIHHLLKNHAFISNVKKPPPSPRPPSKGNNTPLHTRLNRPTYRLESPKPEHFVLDVSSNNEFLPADSDQFEFDVIEAPQKFRTDFYVDWRIFSLVFWSRCYCRYDHNYLPTLREQQLSYELSCREEDIRKARTKSRRRLSTDPLHSMHHANSWHPIILNTNF